MSGRYRNSRLAFCSIFALIYGLSPVAAQSTVDGAQPAADAAKPADALLDDGQARVEEAGIVVTGSLIRSPALAAQAPVQVLDQAETELRQTNTAEELLRSLPGAVAGLGSSVNNQGVSGASTADLRGLGANRNLVLLDGNRLVPANLTGVTDLNNIPLALIRQTEVLTGGASTTYGADAISGVVNFITRDDFDGIEASVSRQITQRGDGSYLRADLTGGLSTSDGRSGFVVSVGYQKSDPVYQGEREFSRVNISSTTGLPAGSTTGVPSRISIAGTSLGSRQIDPVTGALVTPFSSYNFNPLNLLQTPFQRYNVFGAGKHELADGITIYARGMASENTVRTIQAPSGLFGAVLVVPLSNPYLPVAARNQICAASQINAAQCAAAAAANNPSDPSYRTFTANVFRRSTEVGPRVTDYRTRQFDQRIGVRGDVTNDITFDVSGSYGESKNVQDIRGYVSTSRFADAALATNPQTCLSGNAGCVPVNIFGDEGSITPEMNKYLTADSVTFIKTSLAQVRGLVSGKLGYRLPWAEEEVDFAVGAEHRRYTAEQGGDELSRSGDLGGNTGAVVPIMGGYNVTEGFAELGIPVAQGIRGIDSLVLNAGLRYSNYKIDAPGDSSFSTTTWKLGGEYAPVPGVRLRGIYQRAVRAPNIGELFTPSLRTLTQLTRDLCSGGGPVNDANLRAVCLAQGAPVNTIGVIPAVVAGLVNQTTGGNPGLQPEISKSYTLGVVLQPRSIIPGFSTTVDYYDIKIDQAISAPTAADVYGNCFNNLTTASATNPICTQIRRNPIDGSLNGNNVPGIPLPRTNSGRYHASGIDVGVQYRREIGNVTFSTSLNGNWTRIAKFKASPISLNRDCAGYYSISCGSLQPKFTWNHRTSLSYREFDFSLLWRHLDSMEQEPLAIAACCGFDRIPAFDYFDLSLRVEPSDNMTLVFSVQNLADKEPPLVGSSVGVQNPSFNSGNTFPSTYDTLGRRFAVGATMRF